MDHEKLTRKLLLKIRNDDTNIRNSIISSLKQAQEYLNIKESEIATDDMSDLRIHSYELLLSNLRTISEEIGTAVTSPEIFFKIARIDKTILDRIIEGNVKLLTLANEINSITKTDFDISLVKEKTVELRDTFQERQKLFTTSKIIL